MSIKKNTRSNQMSVRFSEDEHDFISWLARRIDVERANVPRHVLAAFMTDRADLVAEFRASQREAEVSLPEVMLHPNPEVNALVLADLSERSNGSMSKAAEIIQKCCMRLRERLQTPEEINAGSSYIPLEDERRDQFIRELGSEIRKYCEEDREAENEWEAENHIDELREYDISVDQLFNKYQSIRSVVK